MVVCIDGLKCVKLVGLAVGYLKVGCRDVGMLGCWIILIFGWLDDWIWIVRYLNGKTLR